MNTYKFPKHPNARSNSPWRLSKNVIETEQTLPTSAIGITGTFNGERATFVRDTERVSGDTHLNERRRIVGFTVIIDGFMQSFRPENIHLLFNYEGFHEGCTDKCHCQVYKSDKEYFEHTKNCKCS